MRKVIALLLALGGVPACAAIGASLPTIIAVIEDASLVIQTIEAFVNAFFIRRPDFDAEDKIRKAIAKTRSALIVAVRATQGVEKLTQEQVDAAFADFKTAYLELIALVSPLGVSTGESLRALPNGGLQVPEPMALTFKAPS